MPDWKQCESELAGGEFPLERYLDGSDGSAVFLTRFASRRAVVKLVLAGQAQAAELVERWNRAATFHHPHLVRILATGTSELAGMPLAYFVMEYAEENLAEVLRERPLSTDETRDMLQPVAEALAYLHGQGLVHGNLKPSNILAVEDTVKISSETVSAGDPAADIRALGVVLLQALRSPAADALPFPFREVARNCRSAGEIVAWLRSPEPTAPMAKPAARKPRLRYYVAAAAVLVLGAAIAAGVAMHRTAAPEAVPEAARPVAPPLAPPVVPDRQAEPPHSVPAAQDEITRRVLPDIPVKARNTIHGKATVEVGVAVDASGNVTKATLEPGGSAYFGALALEAARQWQCAAVEGARPRNWVLRFEIMPTETQVTPVRAGRE
jgi:tRNA A-37 threonylcarbamoyl transferase component Bud32